MSVATLHVVKEDLAVNPVLVQFTNGEINKNSTSEQLQFRLYKSSHFEDIRKKSRRTLIAQTKKMKYTGNNFGVTSRSSSLCKYFVGVYNKASGTMKVYDTTTCQMQPKISVDEVDNTETNAELSFSEKSDRLVEAFGSNKRKRAMKSRIQNAIDANELGQSVSSAVTHMLSQPDQKVSSTEDENDMLPRYNKDAKDTAEIYPLSSLLDRTDFDALGIQVKDFIAEIPDKLSLWKKENRFCEYVLDHFLILPVNEVDKNRKVTLLLYFSYLVQFYHLNYKAVQKRDPLPGVPDVIKEKIFSLFSLQQAKSRCVPKRLKDKLVFHLTVLALIIDGFTIDCGVLSKDLKMALQRFCNYAKSVGCTIESTQDIRKRKLGEDNAAVSKRAVLQAPLPKDFPNHIPVSSRKK